MCDPVTMTYVATAAMAVGTVAQGQQAKQQGKYERGVSEYNAAQMKNEATQTRNKAVEAENVHREKVQQMIARQRVQGAAQNIDVGGGSILQLQQDTETLGDADALRIRSNFNDQAEAIEQGSLLELSRGRAAERAGRTAFKTSLLKAAGQTALGVSSAWALPSSAAATGTGAAAGATGTGAAASGFNQNLWNTNSALLIT